MELLTLIPTYYRILRCEANGFEYFRGFHCLPHKIVELYNIFQSFWWILCMYRMFQFSFQSLKIITTPSRAVFSFVFRNRGTIKPRMYFKKWDGGLKKKKRVWCWNKHHSVGVLSDQHFIFFWLHMLEYPYVFRHIKRNRVLKMFFCCQVQHPPTDFWMTTCLVWDWWSFMLGRTLHTLIQITLLAVNFTVLVCCP